MLDNINYEKLFEVIIKLKTIDDCKIFFEDLCTYTELDSMAQRVESAKMLLEGKTYEEIIESTKISSATLSRVNKCVKFGKGYKKFIKVKNK